MTCILFNQEGANAGQLRWKTLKTGRYPAAFRLTGRQTGKRRMEAINGP